MKRIAKKVLSILAAVSVFLPSIISAEATDPKQNDSHESNGNQETMTYNEKEIKKFLDFLRDWEKINFKPVQTTNSGFDSREVIFFKKRLVALNIKAPDSEYLEKIEKEAIRLLCEKFNNQDETEVDTDTLANTLYNFYVKNHVGGIEVFHLMPCADGGKSVVTNILKRSYDLAIAKESTELKRAKWDVYSLICDKGFPKKDLKIQDVVNLNSVAYKNLCRNFSGQ